MTWKANLYVLKKLPELVALLEGASPEGQRRFAWRASRLCVETAGPQEEPSIQEALEIAEGLASGGDPNDERVARVRTAALETVRRLDNLQLDMFEQQENAGIETIEPHASEHLAAFRRYVAANAAAMALLADPQEAASEVAVDIATGSGIDRALRFELARETLR